MKSLLLFISICFSQALFSQTVPLDSVANYVGKTVTVCGKVESAYVTKGEKKTTYLSFGKPYPNHILTVVIFEKDLENFKYVPAEHLESKNVCITGKVVMYKEKPEIIVHGEDQIKVK